MSVLDVVAPEPDEPRGRGRRCAAGRRARRRHRAARALTCRSNTDTLLATAVAEGVVARTPGTLVGPVLALGCSAHHLAFPGTVSLRISTFVATVVDVCRSLAAAGPDRRAGERPRRQPRAARRRVDRVERRGNPCLQPSPTGTSSRTSWPRRSAPPPREACGHACALETSLMQHLASGQPCARTLIPPDATPPTWPDPHMFSTDAVQVVRPFEELSADGVIGRPSLATPELGRRLFERGRRTRVPRGRAHHAGERVSCAAGAGPDHARGGAWSSSARVRRGPLRQVRTYDVHAAGSELNVAIGAAQLGLRVGWISRLGADDFGDLLLSAARAEGMDTSQVVRGRSRSDRDIRRPTRVPDRRPLVVDVLPRGVRGLAPLGRRAGRRLPAQRGDLPHDRHLAGRLRRARRGGGHRRRRCRCRRARDGRST